MSAQLSQHITTRLLIAEKSENKAHQIDSCLRDAGIAAKLSITDDIVHIAQLLSAGDADIALISSELKGLKQLLPRLRANTPHLPIIIMIQPAAADNGADPSLNLEEALTLGATDAIPADDTSLLSLVVKRELAHVCQREHFVQVRRALTEAEQRCQLLLQGSRAAIAYVHEGMHIHANDGYLQLFGYASTDDLYGVSLVDVLSTDSATTLKGQLKKLRNGADEQVFNFHGHATGGGDVNGSMTLTNSQYQGEPCLQVTVRPAETDRTCNGGDFQASEEGPAQSSGTDWSEALPEFISAAESAFMDHSAGRYMMIVAIDNMAESQRSYGLAGTNTICSKVWQMLSEITAEHPQMRLSRDQFAIALSASNLDEAMVNAEQWRGDINELMFEIEEKTVRPTVTVSGVELFRETDVARVLDAAAINLLDMREAGAANVVKIPTIDALSDDSAPTDAKALLHQITEAIDKQRFVLLFQPIISLRGDSDEHYEVFLRMTNADGQRIKPGKFLQTAIDNNVAGKIDRWVTLQSIKVLSQHRAKGHNTRLTINLTRNSVSDPEFLEWLSTAIKAARLPCDAVIFQITEKDAVTYLRQTREFIDGLRAMHCRASLSRFGLIADPFETLGHLPVDMVKLDGKFIERVNADPDNSNHIAETVKQLQEAGKLTVVPMVENAKILSTLWQAGVNYIQGHYLQEPSTEMDYDFSTEE